MKPLTIHQAISVFPLNLQNSVRLWIRQTSIVQRILKASLIGTILGVVVSGLVSPVQTISASPKKKATVLVKSNDTPKVRIDAAL